MMAGTMKIPLPMIVPITMPRQESKLSLWGVLMGVDEGLNHLQVPLLQLSHGMINGAGSEGHVSDGWVLAA